MTRLVIQIPAYNESQTIMNVLNEIPRHLETVDEIIILVIDDGSIDNTSEVALENGADVVVRHRKNRGLSNAFMTGIHTSLKLGADIIVNTDADNQYPSDSILPLISPILNNSADMVIGNRNPGENKNFSLPKRLLEVAGSWVLRKISGTEVPDAPSGFRAYSRYTALRLQAPPAKKTGVSITCLQTWDETYWQNKFAAFRLWQKMAVRLYPCWRNESN